MPHSDRLKLLVITPMYEPDCVGIAAIASDMCTALAERGHDITVLTTHPYYPEWKSKARVRRWRIDREHIQRVRVRRHRIFIPANPSRLIPRLFHEISFPASLLRSLVHGRRYDLVMVYCPLMGGILFAALRKLLFRDPLWINVQDIPVEAAAASGIIKSGWFARLASLVQKTVLNRADAWSTISPDMRRQLDTIKRKGMPVYLCPNWITGSLRQAIAELAEKEGHAPGQSVKLLYCGTIGRKQGLLSLCRRLSETDGDFVFDIRGDGGEAPAVRDWVKSSGDPRFSFDSLLAEAEFVRAIHRADWFVVPQQSSAGRAFFPSKLIPAMNLGTPALAISDDSGPLYEEVKEHQIGMIVPWSELDQLPAKLATYQRDPEHYQTLRANCLRRAQAYDRENAIDHIEALLRQQVSCRATSAKGNSPKRSDSKVTTT